jgi:hypothetical protein
MLWQQHNFHRINKELTMQQQHRKVKMQLTSVNNNTGSSFHDNNKIKHKSCSNNKSNAMAITITFMLQNINANTVAATMTTPQQYHINNHTMQWQQTYHHAMQVNMPATP